MPRAWRIGLTLAALAAAGVAVSLALGSRAIAPWELARVLFAPDGSVNAQIVHELRLPRVLAAFGTGGLLAIAGALMQVLLRNPLADPYVMGASGGAAVGALGAMLLGAGGLLIQGGAFGGALASTALVFALARREFAGASLADPGTGAPRLLLAGVMLAAWPLGRALNVLLRGPLIAQALGVRVQGLRRLLFVLASLATAVAVTTSGAVGFVGLVVPHALRLAIGNDQRVLLPACALAGGTLLVLADSVARTVVAPQQLPVGLVTALLGVPSFLVLLLGRR